MAMGVAARPLSPRGEGWGEGVATERSAPLTPALSPKGRGRSGRIQIVEQCFKLSVKQRQPVLGAGRPAAFTHRFVEHVVRGRRAEGRHITGTKQPDGVGGELEFRHRHQIERAQFLGRALGFRVEAADRLQRIAEEIEPHRVGHAGREQIDDAATHRIIAGLAHRT